MKRMALNVKRGVILAVLVLSASACSSNNGNGTGTTGNTAAPPPVVTAPPPPPRQEDQFGTAFGVAFRAAMNSEPAAVMDGDIVPISLTTEPVAVN